MRTVFLSICVFCLLSCSNSSNNSQIVVPVNTLSITFNNKTYNEVSDASHPIVASIVLGKDAYYNNSISIVSVSANTKNLFIGFEGQNTNVGNGLGIYDMGLRNDSARIYCPYYIIDKGDSSKLYLFDSLSNVIINRNDPHVISGTFILNLRLPHIDTLLPYLDSIRPCTGNFTYNLYYGTH